MKKKRHSECLCALPVIYHHNGFVVTHGIGHMMYV